MRRAVSLLLCVALVSAQWLSGGQCHAAPSGCSAEHDARPHIHVGHADSHHHHDSPAADEGPAWCDESAGHETDIVVLPDLTSAAPGRAVASQMVHSSAELLAAVLTTMAMPPGNRTTGAHPPPPILPDCPLFLRTLSIRC